MTDLSKLKIMWEVALLPNTDLLQQVEDYVRGCTTTTKYWEGGQYLVEVEVEAHSNMWLPYFISLKSNLLDYSC
jgi:hypothetical protein